MTLGEPETVSSVYAPVSDGGLKQLGLRIGHELEALATQGVDVLAVRIELALRGDEHDRDEWVAELSWPYSADPEGGL